MAIANKRNNPSQGAPSPLAGPPIVPEFAKELDKLVGIARKGQSADSQFYNPPDDWLISRMSILQDMSDAERAEVLEDVKTIDREAREANAAGKVARRAGPGVAVRLDNGGLAFFSQLGVARRPDLTQYLIDGFKMNRDALAFSEANQALFAEVLSHISNRMAQLFASGEAIIQLDRRIGDAPGRSFHARQLLFGTRYLQVPYMWRQLTFDLPHEERQNPPDIIEVSIPNWLDDLGLPQELKERVSQAGLTQLVFKAPTKGLSLHLGFDYVGEHKMGPLSIAMFLVKQSNGLAVQAALSMARVRTLNGNIQNTAVVTVGPSLHGKSTLTIMIELANSDLASLLGLTQDPEEGVYPMNDDIVLLQPLKQATETVRGGNKIRLSHGIDGTEDNLYAVPFGLTKQGDPITYDVLRGTPESPNSRETLENVPTDPISGTPHYSQNPVRNMRMTLSRQRLLARKGAEHLLERITNGTIRDSVHVPMEYTDQVFWQAVMRQNTVIPPLRRMALKQYIRVLMYGEAVQMGAAVGAIGRPYVEFFSDPFIIGLEDENANLLLPILQQMERGGMPQRYYVFNSGGVGADSNEEASGSRYKKIPKELTLTLQEALLRDAVKFEHDPALGSDIAVAIVNDQGEEVLNLKKEWLPREIYGEDEYNRRILELRRRRYFGRDDRDKAGILRYTKVTDAIMDVTDIPTPGNERELAWLLSFYWHVDQAYNSLPELALHRDEGQRPAAQLMMELQRIYEACLSQGVDLPQDSRAALSDVGISANKAP